MIKKKAASRTHLQQQKKTHDDLCIFLHLFSFKMPRYILNKQKGETKQDYN